jgi:predicted transcriptional regulator YdeE
MEATIIALEPILLAGLSFYGDPFNASDVWTEENQIGQLWQRFMKYLKHHQDELDETFQHGPFYEVHLYGPETESEGLFEVFVGSRIPGIEELPYHLMAKRLPSTQYAVFTLSGKEIVGDWEQEILAWLDQNGYRESYPFNFQYYDARYKGLDSVDDSEIDVYLPIEAT